MTLDPRKLTVAINHHTSLLLRAPHNKINHFWPRFLEQRELSIGDMAWWGWEGAGR